MVDFAVSYFSTREHYDRNQVEKFSLPTLLNYSEKLKDGKIFDVSIFKNPRTTEQLEYCRRVFKYARTFKINTESIEAQEVLSA